MNTVNICGRTTKDIELRKTPTGSSIVKFTVAVSRNGGDVADFIPVTAFGNLADAICKFVRKGDFIGISGHLKIDTKDTSDGRRTFFDVVADRVEFLGGGQRPEQHYSTPENSYNAAVAATQLPQQLNQGQDEDWVDPNDLPF